MHTGGAFHGVHSPWCLRCGLRSLRYTFSLVPWIWARWPTHPCGSTGWPGGDETGTAAAREFPKLPQSTSFFPLFLFEKFLLLNPAAPYKKGPVLSLSPPLQLDWGLSGSGPHMAQLSTFPSLHPWSLWVYHFILIPLPVTSSNQVSLGAAQALFGRGGSR